ncbi:hypothetical protein ACFSKU_06355 [Pontibacter silvestris]|uniref:Uncharacterized protein n=1 Tax=Pontibacter silvestris TaxID=2305183 RepID=A0ABW4WV36_9BACT|nr:hypothetical protein [Pontibacter silvestris]MCC9136456.1 hypothetical protein [Pontibacter silvestris]
MRKTFLTLAPVLVLIAAGTQDAGFETGLDKSIAKLTVSKEIKSFNQPYMGQVCLQEQENTELQPISLVNTEDLYQNFTKRVVGELGNALQVFF